MPIVLIAASEVRTRLEASAVSGLTRFVGRAKEMETLSEALDKARSGQGQVVGIVGEAGVGKSRIIFEMRHMFPEYTYLEGRCLHYGGSMAYLPLLDILRSYFGIKEGEREYLINKKMKEKLASPRCKPHPSPFQDLLSLEPDEAYRHLEPKEKRERIFEALRDLFIRESQKRPLVLIIEDLHWIDKTSEEFLDYLIGWLANDPHPPHPSLPARIHPPLGEQVLLHHHPGGSALPPDKLRTRPVHPLRRGDRPRAS